MLDAEKCPDCQRINEVLSRVGDRWSVLVVISLAQYGTMRFNALKRNLGISQRMLSLTLRGLERDGLVNRTYHPTIPPKVEYNLTPMGESFRDPVFWGPGRWKIWRQSTPPAPHMTRKPRKPAEGLTLSALQ